MDRRLAVPVVAVAVLALGAWFGQGLLPSSTFKDDRPSKLSSRPFLVEADSSGALVLQANGVVEGIDRRKGVVWRDAQFSKRRRIVCAGPCPDAAASGSFGERGVPAIMRLGTTRKVLTRAVHDLILVRDTKRRTIAVQADGAQTSLVISDSSGETRIPFPDESPQVVMAADQSRALILAGGGPMGSVVFVADLTGPRWQVKQHEGLRGASFGCVDRSSMLLMRDTSATLLPQRGKTVQFALNEPASCALGSSTVLFYSVADSNRGSRTTLSLYTRSGQPLWSKTLDSLARPSIAQITDDVLIVDGSTAKIYDSNSGQLVRTIKGVVDARFAGDRICAVRPNGSVEWLPV